MTDANVALGYLSPEAFLGGRMNLRRDLAEQAIRTHVAEPLGISVQDAALGILSVVNENMLAAIRTVSIERGIDPRPYTMVGGGGAGPLHAGRLAAELGLGRVVVPAVAGTLSAYGMTVADVRHDYSATLYTTGASPDVERVAQTLGAIEAEAVEDLRAGGTAPEAIRLDRTVDARYVGQVHEITIPVPDGPVDLALFETCVRTFHATHTQRFGYALADTDVEFLHWRLAGRGLVPALARPEAAADAPSVDIRELGVAHTVRDAYDPGAGAVIPVHAYAADAVPPEAVIVGPALIDSATTTIVVESGQRAAADGRGGFVITIDAPALAGSGAGDTAEARR